MNNDFYLNEQKIIELNKQLVLSITINILMFISGSILFFMLSVYEDNYWNTHAVIEPYVVEGRKVMYVTSDQVIKQDETISPSTKRVIKFSSGGD